MFSVEDGCNEVEEGDSDLEFLLGRPRFGLSASATPSLKYATFRSDQFLNSVLSDLSLFRPTLIMTVVRDGLESILKGPLYLEDKPLMSCCLAYT